ncbi:MAG: DUF1415 domain-containing protein [Caldimonas sp.]
MPNSNPQASTPDSAIAQTKAWVERVVIGLNLCPFAKAAQAHGRTRYVCSDAAEPEALLAAFRDEVRTLLGTPSADLETTLLIHPCVLGDFDDYNDFLDVADAALEALGAVGVLQVASFHPQYRFAGTAADDITNATNRSPHPVLQLLREASVDAAVASFPDGAAIYEANIATLRRIGPEGWAALQAECSAAAAGATDTLPSAD